jgi:hypothetical protein
MKASFNTTSCLQTAEVPHGSAYTTSRAGERCANGEMPGLRAFFAAALSHSGALASVGELDTKLPGRLIQMALRNRLLTFDEDRIAAITI